MEGQSSGAEYILGESGVTSHFAAKDVEEDNLEFEVGNLFDFTNTDPFSEGDL